LSHDEVDRLDSIVRRGRILQRGETLFEIGSPFECIFAVRSGSLKAYRATAEGEEQIIAFHLPGELMGFDGFDAEAHRCTAVALETTSICALPMDRIEELCMEIRGLQRQVHRLLGREIAADQEMLLLLGRGSAEERLAAFLLSLSNRLSQRGFSATRFVLSMSRHDIGNYLGLALETVSRQFARFQANGVMSVRRREVEIDDIDALRGIVSDCLGVVESPGAERNKTG
jgi:CRP/FNR family transcriptional regulator